MTNILYIPVYVVYKSIIKLQFFLSNVIFFLVQLSKNQLRKALQDKYMTAVNMQINKVTRRWHVSHTCQTPTIWKLSLGYDFNQTGGNGTGDEFHIVFYSKLIVWKQNKKVILQALLSGEDCVAVLPTGYGKPELSILNFPVRGSEINT
jgi:hypothetical protein